MIELNTNNVNSEHAMQSKDSKGNMAEFGYHVQKKKHLYKFTQMMESHKQGSERLSRREW